MTSTCSAAGAGESPFPSERKRLVCFNVRRLGWYAVSAVVAAVIFGSVLLLAANLYVQSQTVQQRIRQALTTTLHMPVTVRKTTVTPWEGLRIDGLTARVDSAGPAFLTADSFRVRFALWPLLHRQFVVTLLWLDKPQLAWAQDPDGHWQFPPDRDARRHKKTAREIPADTPAPTGTIGPAPTPDVTLSTPRLPPVAEVGPSPHRPAGFTVALDRFRMRHGSLDFFNAKHRPIGQLEEVNLDGRLEDPQHASGTVWCDKAHVPRPGLTLSQFHSDFAYDQNTGLTLSDGRAVLAGGTLTARGHVDPRNPGSPFSAECRMERVDLGKLLQETGNRLPMVQGGLQGKVVFSGRSDQPEGRQASGRFELVDARLKDFPLFQSLGDALGIADLSHMRFKKAQLDCRLDGTTLQVEPLLLVSNDLKITAQGHYATDEDRLDLQARLVIDEAVSRQLPDFIGTQFKPGGDDAPGSRFVDFTVTGPLSNPKSSLYNRLLGDPMKGFLHDLLAPKPKTPKEKFLKHHPDPSPPPASPGGTESGT